MSEDERWGISTVLPDYNQIEGNGAHMLKLSSNSELTMVHTIYTSSCHAIIKHD